MAIAQATTDMIARMFPHYLGDDGAGTPALEATLLERIRGHIETMLGSSGLSVDALCQTFGVLASALYRLFQPLGAACRPTFRCAR